MRNIILLTCVLASQAFGQSSIFTPVVKLTANSSQYYLHLWNSNASTLQEVLNGPCPSGPTTFSPAVYQWDPNPSVGAPLSVFSTDMSKSTYRDNVNIQSIWIRLCYSLYGSVSRHLILTPVMHDTITGDVYEPQVTMPIIPPGWYWVQTAEQPWVLWDFSAFTLSSQQLSTGRYEFGIRVKYLYPTPPEVVDSTAVKIHAMTTFATFTTSANVTSLGTPQITYTTYSDFSQAKVNLTTVRPKPSTAQGGRIYIQCSNGTQVEIATFGWNFTDASTYTNSWNMSFLNLPSKCGGTAQAGQVESPLVRNGTTRIGTAATDIYGNNNGDIQWSNTVTLN